MSETKTVYAWIEGRVRDFKAFFDLLFSNTDEPRVLIDESYIYARNMDDSRRTLYDFKVDLLKFLDYEVERTIMVKLDRHYVKDALKGKKADERVKLTVYEDRVTFNNEYVGEILPEEKKPYPPHLPSIDFKNTIYDVDTVRLRTTLSSIRRAKAEYLGFAYKYKGNEAYIIAFNTEYTTVEKPVINNIWFRIYNPYIYARASIAEDGASVFNINEFLQFFPSTVYRSGANIRMDIHGVGYDMPIKIEVYNLPLDIDMDIWIAPLIDVEYVEKKPGEYLFEKISEAKPHIEGYFKLDATLERAFELFEVLHSNVDAAEVFFDLGKFRAYNMDSSRVTLCDLTIDSRYFTDYYIKKPVYAGLFFLDRAINTLRALKALDVDQVAVNIYEDTSIWLEGVVDGQLIGGSLIGYTNPKMEGFTVGELKMEFPNMVEVGVREFNRFLRDGRRNGFEYVGFAVDPETGFGRIYLLDDRMEETVMPEGTYKVKSLGSYQIKLVQQFIVPSITRVRGRGMYLGLASGYNRPLMIDYIEYELRFKCYIAPYVDASEPLAKKLGWLKKISKEEVLKRIREYGKPVTEWQLKNDFLDLMDDVSVLDNIIRELLKEKRIVEKREGWESYYYLPDQPPPLKPLTEDVVLEYIRSLCDAWNTDSVGFNEVKATLGREYDTSKLHDILRSLREKDLVVSKTSPEKIGTRTAVATDLNGYWGLKPTEPEEVVEQSEKVKLKELTPDEVLKAMEELHEFVGAIVYYNDINDILRDKGYDTTSLPEILDRLRDEKKILIRSDGRIWTMDYWRRRQEKPPPIPEGYCRVKFLRDMVRYIGFDRKYYGPYKTGETAVIEKRYADHFSKYKFVEVIKCR